MNGEKIIDLASIQYWQHDYWDNARDAMLKDFKPVLIAEIDKHIGAADTPQFETWAKDECIEFLKNNYGLRGFNGKGITREEGNRTLDNMRRECRNQYHLHKALTEYNSGIDNHLK